MSGRLEGAMDHLMVLAVISKAMNLTSSRRVRLKCFDEL